MCQSQPEWVPDVPRVSGAALSPLLTDYVMHYGRLYGCVVFYHHFFPPHRLSLQRVTRLLYLDHSVKLTRYFLCSQTSIGRHTSPERILKMCSISYQWMTGVAEEKGFHVNNVHAKLSTVCRLFLSKRFYLTVLLSLVRLCMSIDTCMHTHQDLCNDRLNSYSQRQTCINKTAA